MLYHIYVFYKVIKDKIYQKCIDYYYSNYVKVERLDDTIVPSAFNDMYNLFTNPTHIIDNIYIGNAYNAADYYTLKKLGIKKIVNVSEEISNYFPSEFEYYNIKVLDNEDGRLKPHYNKFISFTNQSNKSNDDKDNNILVHCFMGSSRSATLVVLYLMRNHHMTFEDAYKFIKNKRNIVNLNTMFAKELITSQYEI